MNIRLLIWLVIPTILLGCGILVVHRIQINRSSRVQLELANRAVANGDVAKAEECLRLVLGYEPNHSAARTTYGLLIASRARSPDDRLRAMGMLEHALRLDPDRTDVRRRVVELAMSLELFAVAQTNLTILVGRSEPTDQSTGTDWTPEDGELLELLAQCSERRHDYVKASLWYKSAITRAAERIDTYVRRSDLLRKRLGDANEADRVMDAPETKDGLIAANGRRAAAYLERARYRQRYEIEGSDQDIARALELGETDADVLLTAVAFAMARGDLTLASRHLTIGLEHDPGNWRLTDAMAGIHRRSGKLNLAKACLGRGIEASADSQGRSRLMWVLADLLIDEGQWTDAKDLIARLGKERVVPELLSYLGARIKVGESRWLEASSELEAIYPRLAGKSALTYQIALLLGQCYEHLGDIDRRYGAFWRAVTLEPQGIPGRLGLAAALAAMGKLDDALGFYRSLIGKSPIAGPALARLLIVRDLRRPPKSETGGKSKTS